MAEVTRVMKTGAQYLKALLGRISPNQAFDLLFPLYPKMAAESLPSRGDLVRKLYHEFVAVPSVDFDS